jgi:hypothetical protein
MQHHPAEDEARERLLGVYTPTAQDKTEQDPKGGPLHCAAFLCWVDSLWLPRWLLVFGPGFEVLVED